jgi:hypothetical protein
MNRSGGGGIDIRRPECSQIVEGLAGGRDGPTRLGRAGPSPIYSTECMPTVWEIIEGREAELIPGSLGCNTREAISLARGLKIQHPERDYEVLPNERAADGGRPKPIFTTRKRCEKPID